MGPLGVCVLPIGGGVNLDFGTSVGSHDAGDIATPANLGSRCSGIYQEAPEAPELLLLLLLLAMSWLLLNSLHRKSHARRKRQSRQTPNKPRSASSALAQLRCVALGSALRLWPRFPLSSGLPVRYAPVPPFFRRLPPAVPLKSPRLICAF